MENGGDPGSIPGRGIFTSGENASGVHERIFVFASAGHLCSPQRVEEFRARVSRRERAVFYLGILPSETR
jgi:hypothetical protein